MREPILDPPDARGTRWLQAKVLELLAGGTETSAAGTPTCAWGTSFETRGTLYLGLPGEAETTTFHFTTAMIAACGAGHRGQQAQAITAMRRRLRQRGLLAGDPRPSAPEGQGAHDGEHADS